MTLPIQDNKKSDSLGSLKQTLSLKQTGKDGKSHEERSGYTKTAGYAY